MRQIKLLPLLALVLILAACSQGAAPASAPLPGDFEAMPAPTQAPAAEAPAAGGSAIEDIDGSTGVDQQSNAQQPASQRLVIKNANITVQVENVTQAEASVRARAEQLGGYVVSVSTSGSDQYLTSLIVFRVPAESFESALADVEGLAREVLSRTVSGDDVTEEFVDLGSRLRNLEATRDRLLELLARAEAVEDALQVNQALTDVQGEIEQIQGRRQFLQQSAAFSTITAELRPVPPPPTIIEEDGWQPLNVAAEALRGLVEFGQGIVNVAIVLLVWAPVWLPLLLLARWAWRRRPPMPGRKPAPPPPPASPIA